MIPPEVFAHEIGHIANIAYHAEPGVVPGEHKTDGFRRIMGNTKGVDGDIPK